MLVIFREVLSFPVKLITFIYKLIICAFLHVISSANQGNALSSSLDAHWLRASFKNCVKSSHVLGRGGKQWFPLTNCGPATMPSNDTHTHQCYHLTNNCLYFIKFHSDSGIPESISAIAKSSFTVEEINIAYLTIRDSVPESDRHERCSKNLSPEKKITQMCEWLKTTMAIFVCPENPYSLPPAKPADLNLISVHNVAKKALVTSESLSKVAEDANAIPELRNDLSKMTSQIEEMRRQQEVLIDSLKNFRDLTNHSTAGPPPKSTPASPHYSPGVPSQDITLSSAETTEGQQPAGSVPSPPPPSIPSYSEVLTSNIRENTDGWQLQTRRKRDKPNRNNNNNSAHQSDNKDSSTQRQKRCHVVIHNLHSSVTYDNIKERVIELTGSEPLIL